MLGVMMVADEGLRRREAGAEFRGERIRCEGKLPVGEMMLEGGDLLFFPEVKMLSFLLLRTFVEGLRR